MEEKATCVWAGLEKEEDLEFASIMVQNLNNNLITAPELADLRKRLRNLDTKVKNETLAVHVSLLILVTGWPDILRYALQILVPQCCGYFLTVPSGTSLRTSLRPTTDFVCPMPILLRPLLT